MQLPLRSFIIALLAVVLYFPAATGQQPAAGQQPPTVNVRSRVATPLVTVNRSRVPLGELVTFALTPAGVLMNSRHKLTLYFGDHGAHQVIGQNPIDYLYRKPGTYTYSILIEPPDALASGPAPPPPSVNLSAIPTSVEINRPVDFAAQLSRPDPNIKYRFAFGDGSQTDWQSQPVTTHTYKSANSYLAYVDIGTMRSGGVKRLGGSVRQPIEVRSPPPRPVSVTLSANPMPVAAKQPATFVARVDSSDPNIRYRFDFGDRSGSTAWQASAQATHTYSTAGNYQARVEIRVVSSRSGPQTASSNPLPIEVTTIEPEPKPAVNLTAIPQSVLAGLPVFFRATAASANSNTRYRFNFGDGSASGWKDQPEETHIYTRAGDYPAFVEIGSAGNRPMASGGKRIRVGPGIVPSATPTPPQDKPTPLQGTPTPLQGTPTPAPDTSPSPVPSESASTTGSESPATSPSAPASPAPTETPAPPQDVGGSSNDWWKYLLALLILFGVYQGWKAFYAPRPTLVSNLDPGSSELGSKSGPLGINFQMELNPNVTDGQVAVKTDGGSLIKSERKSDG